jgi:hypothetical protein
MTALRVTPISRVFGVPLLQGTEPSEALGTSYRGIADRSDTHSKNSTTFWGSQVLGSSRVAVFLTLSVRRQPKLRRA